MTLPPIEKSVENKAVFVSATGWTENYCQDGTTLAKRNSMPIYYTFDHTFTPMMKNAAILGMAAWNKISNGKISFQLAPKGHEIAPYVNTNPGILFTSLNGWISPDPYALATTRPNDLPTNELTLSVMTINTGPYDFHQGGAFYIFKDPKHPNKKPSADINLVLLHELGHCLGFGHSKNNDSIMFPNIHQKMGNNGFSTDDIVGINTVYP